ncbi:MAG: hypothetical protein VB013_13850 [Anaerolineaceae bacterium]|nr:hypothetical protein [Anaerolineaceae bacterium]
MKIKRFVFVFVSLALLLAVFPYQTAIASSLRETTGGISVVAISGDSSFSTAVIKPESLAGIQTVSDGIYPAGFIAKEAQFIGNALNVADHTYGEAKVCFAFATSTQGWVGNVYQWDGAKWNKLTTTLNTPTDGTPSACANFYGNGDLALIGAYTGPREKSSTTANLPACFDNETGTVPEGFHAVWPAPVLVKMGEGYVVIGVRFFTFSGSAMSTVVESGIPVKAWVIDAGPDDVVKVIKSKGSGASGAMGLTDALLTYKIVKEDPYTFKFKIVVDGKCQQEFNTGMVD